MRPRRVLHVLNGAGGGAALSTIELIEALREEGIEASAVCHEMGGPGDRERVTEALGGRVLFTPLYWWNRKIRAAAWKRPILELMQLRATGWRRGARRRVAEFARSENVDLVHTNTLMTPEGGWAARRLGLPHVWHVRELVGPGTPYRMPKEGPALGRYLSEHASAVVANSHATARCLSAWLPSELLTVVCNGIVTRRFTSLSKSRTDGPLVVGMVGNLTSWKNPLGFVEAAAHVDRSLRVQFRLYGHLPAEKKLAELNRRITERNVADRVRMMGFVDDPAKIMSQLDLLVHPAADESFGRILVEAMAAGLPVVAARGGGAAEIIVDGETGFLSPAGSPDELAGAIERLARDAALRSAMGMAGRRRAIAQYDISRCKAEILGVYERSMRKPLAPADGEMRP